MAGGVGLYYIRKFVIVPPCAPRPCRDIFSIMGGINGVLPSDQSATCSAPVPSFLPGLFLASQSLTPHTFDLFSVTWFPQSKFLVESRRVGPNNQPCTSYCCTARCRSLAMNSS